MQLLDPKAGVCCLYASQLKPAEDQISAAQIECWERAVYQQL